MWDWKLNVCNWKENKTKSNFNNQLKTNTCDQLNCKINNLVAFVCSLNYINYMWEAIWTIMFDPHAFLDLIICVDQVEKKRKVNSNVWMKNYHVWLKKEINVNSKIWLKNLMHVTNKKKIKFNFNMWRVLLLIWSIF
jgi:hypothetical protein